MIPVLSDHLKEQIMAVEDLILSEVNVKEIEYITDESGILVKKIKPNFKALGPKFGKMMKKLAGSIISIDQAGIKDLERNGSYMLEIEGQDIEITVDDVEISTEDIPGWSVATEGQVSVALDITVTDELKEEGLAREFVNRVQNLRKDMEFEVTDRIILNVEKSSGTDKSLNSFSDYICSETLSELNLVDSLEGNNIKDVELLEGVNVKLQIVKL